MTDSSGNTDSRLNSVDWQDLQEFLKRVLINRHAPYSEIPDLVARSLTVLIERLKNGAHIQDRKAYAAGIASNLLCQFLSNKHSSVVPLECDPVACHDSDESNRELLIELYSQLTDEEVRFFKLMAYGENQKDIAERLGCSDRTVRRIKQDLYAKCRNIRHQLEDLDDTNRERRA